MPDSEELVMDQVVAAMEVHRDEVFGALGPWHMEATTWSVVAMVTTGGLTLVHTILVGWVPGHPVTTLTVTVAMLLEMRIMDLTIVPHIDPTM
jgi:hypothetical protein